ncbi:hypothetical protein DP117_16655 [Brasilonema sp. UFV-L1]|nr:hypothetical protein [Brasilonema sp. UFV-L1]
MEVFSVNQVLRELSKNSQLALLPLLTTTNCSGYKSKVQQPVFRVGEIQKNKISSPMGEAVRTVGGLHRSPLSTLGGDFLRSEFSLQFTAKTTHLERTQ